MNKNLSITFLYKCRKCGGIEKNPKLGPSPDADTKATIELINAILNIRGQAMSPAMLTVHFCGENSCGVADLIGYEPEI